MIRVEQITIREFRGIRNLTLSLHGKNFAVCGPNGTGKSGIVDALEFALTGTISRLTGRGMGEVSVKAHGPHVDFSDSPEKAKVSLTVSFPMLGKSATIERTAKHPTAFTLTPDEPDIRAALYQVGQHPEFALSRRELITYVLATPGDRAKEIEALLRLDRIGQLRQVLLKIANSSLKELEAAKALLAGAKRELLGKLEIGDLKQEAVLSAVNVRRALVGVPELPSFLVDTAINSGVAAPGTPPRIPKAVGVADVAACRTTLRTLFGDVGAKAVSGLEARLAKLNEDPAFASGMERAEFLRSAAALVDRDACPVCDTEWDAATLREHIQVKLSRFDKLTEARKQLEVELAPIADQLATAASQLAQITKYAEMATPRIDATVVKEFAANATSASRQIKAFVPIPDTINSLGSIDSIPAVVSEVISSVEAAILKIPDPSEQGAARDYLSVGQDRLERYRKLAQEVREAEARSALATKASATYTSASTEALDAIYKEVEKSFSELYRSINHDDEEKFSAELKPSFGKLGFNVDFYGRGMFPPGAYHSEGHQDSMGLCLYLSLMAHLLGDKFTFAVLDDVLMSVDAGHRREVCRLLKAKFPKTQFILTTHDPIWLRHMETEGLIERGQRIHFRNWHVDHGPTLWDDRDAWKEIEEFVAANKVSEAAATLRRYLEYLSAEVCHRLRAKVEFRGDAQFQLGDLLPQAAAQFLSLLKMAKNAASTWGQAELATAIATREATFVEIVARSNVERWQVNTAVHYNEWATLNAQDFKPVAKAYRDLIDAMVCPKCTGTLYVIPEHGDPDKLTCTCGDVTLNLRKKKAA